MKKRLLCMGLGLLLAAGMTGCSTEGKEPAAETTAAKTEAPAAGGETTEEKTEEKAEEGKTTDPKSVKLAYVSMNLANPWNATVKKGFEAACKDLGCEFITIDSE